MTSEDLADRLRLVVVTDPEAASPRSIDEVVTAALAAGARAVQLRDKRASARELYELGSLLLPRVRKAGALLFVNDRTDVALALAADGVHVGPDDLPVEDLRRAVPPGFLIGASSDDPEEARRLATGGASYIGCGTVYPTSSKPDAGAVIGLQGLATVVHAVEVPVVGIGGISPERSEEVAGTGAAGVAALSAVMAAPDVGRAVRGLMAPWTSR